MNESEMEHLPVSSRANISVDCVPHGIPAPSHRSAECRGRNRISSRSHYKGGSSHPYIYRSLYPSYTGLESKVFQWHCTFLGRRRKNHSVLHLPSDRIAHQEDNWLSHSSSSLFTFVRLSRTWAIRHREKAK
jgi:hypothetical protein